MFNNEVWRYIRENSFAHNRAILWERIAGFRYPLGVRKYFRNPIRVYQMNRLQSKCNKLHIGCSTIKLEGFINVDVFKTPAVDFLCSVENLPKYIRPNSINQIYICHLLEHFSRRDAIQILRIFYDFLDIGGELRISVPDIMKITKIMALGKLSKSDLNLAQGIISGGQSTRYDYHKSVFWFDLLKQMLEDVGFSQVQEYSSDVVDSSSLACISGNPISLNIKAFKKVK